MHHQQTGWSCRSLDHDDLAVAGLEGDLNLKRRGSLEEHFLHVIVGCNSTKLAYIVLTLDLKEISLSVWLPS